MEKIPKIIRNFSKETSKEERSILAQEIKLKRTSLREKEKNYNEFFLKNKNDIELSLDNKKIYEEKIEKLKNEIEYYSDSFIKKRFLILR